MSDSRLYQMFFVKSTISNPFKKAFLLISNADKFEESLWDAKTSIEIRDAYLNHIRAKGDLLSNGIVESKEAQKLMTTYEKFIKPQVIKRDLKLHV